MLAWLGLFMFVALIVGVYNESANRKLEREAKLKSIQRRRAALEAKKQNQNIESE